MVSERQTWSPQKMPGTGVGVGAHMKKLQRKYTEVYTWYSANPDLRECYETQSSQRHKTWRNTSNKLVYRSEEKSWGEELSRVNHLW